MTNYTTNKGQLSLKRAWTIPVIALAFAGLAFLVLRFAFPQEYSSDIRVLVVQKYTLTDSYTASKSAEKISENLAQVLETSTFLEQVVESQLVDLSNILILSEKDKREEWADMVDPEVLPRTSMLRIRTYDEDPVQAELLANAVSAVLLENGASYHGAPDTVELRVVDSALTSDRPTKPGLLVNTLAAGLLGAILGFIVFVLRPSMSFSDNSTRPPGGGTSGGDGSVVEHSPSSGSAHTPHIEQIDYAVLDVMNYHEALPQRAGHMIVGSSDEVISLTSYTDIAR